MNVVEQSSQFLTQWGLVRTRVLLHTTSDLGEAGKRETGGGGGERKEDCFTKRTLVHTKGAFLQPYYGYAVEYALL